MQWAQAGSHALAPYALKGGYVNMLDEGEQLMMPPLVNEAAPVPPPAYYRAQARLGPALHTDALTLAHTWEGF